MRPTWTAVLALAACTGAAPVDDDVADTDTDVDAATVSFHRTIRPILERNCLGCHAPGGIAPIPLAWDEADPDALQAVFPALAHAVAQGTMPPWMPDESCHPTKDPRVLTPREKAQIATWADAGYPMGDPADHRGGRAAEGPATPADLVLTAAEPYAPSTAADDDYRCFVLDHDFEADAWMRGYDVAPGRVDVVHHVILFRLDAAWADDVAGWDAADAGPGYTCFGSPGTWEADTIAGWAPGQMPESYAPGTARRIPADAPAPEDHTELSLWLLGDEERPQRELYSLPFPKSDLAIAAGDAHSVQVEEVDLDRWVPVKLPVRGTFPHMHQLGTSIRVDVVHDDGTTDCVVDVPSWDFHWQQTYFFEEDDAVWIGNDDTLRLTCTYDNSAANQPVVDGVQQPPKDVTWGETTDQEMCLVYVYATVPAELE